MTAVYIIKFIFKILLLIVFLPFMLLWMFIMYTNYKFILINNMVKSGMPKDMAKSLAKETGPGKMISFINKGFFKKTAANIS